VGLFAGGIAAGGGWLPGGMAAGGGWLAGGVAGWAGVMAAGGLLATAGWTVDAPPAAPDALLGADVGNPAVVGASLPQPPRSAATIKLVAIPDLMTDSSM
jgi:hypothetical protein